MKIKSNRKKTSLLAFLVAGLLALLGFSSCSQPEIIVQDPDHYHDSIGDIRLMYGVPPRNYIEKL